eukprot:gene5211-biopygen13032
MNSCQEKGIRDRHDIRKTNGKGYLGVRLYPTKCCHMGWGLAASGIWQE